MARIRKLLSEPTLSKEEEIFCHAVHDGMRKAEAYRAAFNKPFLSTSDAGPRASELLRRDDIAARIAEIRAEFSHKFEVDRDFLSQNLLHALVIAKRNGSSAEIRKAAMDLGKLHGLVVDKSELNASHQFQVMSSVELNGEALTFDIGTGRVIEPGSAHIFDVSPEDEEGTDLHEEYENATTTPHTQPVLRGEDLL